MLGLCTQDSVFEVASSILHVECTHTHMYNVHAQMHMYIREYRYKYLYTHTHTVQRTASNQYKLFISLFTCSPIVHIRFLEVNSLQCKLLHVQFLHDECRNGRKRQTRKADLILAIKFKQV